MQDTEYIYGIRAERRDDLMRDLQENGVQCGIHYPIPVHLQKAYEFLGYGEGSFPVAEKCAREELSLPMFPELAMEQIRYVGDTIRKSVDQWESTLSRNAF